MLHLREVERLEHGREVHGEEHDLRAVHGRAEGRDVIGIVRGGADRPAHVILLEWAAGRVALIRDYRYVPYLTGELAFEAYRD